jgi:hypothetical protein
MKLRYFIYAPLAMGTFFLMIAVFGKVSLLLFWDVPSVIIVLCPLLFLLLAIFGPRAMVDAFRAVLGSGEATKLELKRAVLFFATAQKILLLIGLLGTLASFYCMVGGYSATLNSGNDYFLFLLVAFLTVFYAFILTMIVTVPFRAALESKLYELEEKE